jgi:integrase/recombinase XerD
MKTPKVRLYVRVRLFDGRHSFVDPSWNKNRTLRQGYALVAGQAEHHPEGIYYLRFLRDDKRVWQPVGPQADEAQAAMANTVLDLQLIASGRTVPDLTSKAKGEFRASPEDQSRTEPQTAEKDRLSLDDAIKAYLSEVFKYKSKRTFAACNNILTQFGLRCDKKYIGSVERADLLGHISALTAKGLSKRTVYNHIARINTLLKANKIIGLLDRNDMPDYDERAPDAYDSDQLQILFRTAKPEERILFEFFLGSGFREQEVMYCTWKDIDFRGKVITVRSKPDLGFRPKDKEERSVPVPDSLIAALVARRAVSTSTYLFPGPGGKPNGHFLRILKSLALRAKLNCGECVNKQRKSCAKAPVCSEWELHKFRRTFATMHSEAGVSPRTIQKWLGHSDLATTLRYLSVADLRSERTRTQVNHSFAALGVGGTN